MFMRSLMLPILLMFACKLSSRPGDLDRASVDPSLPANALGRLGKNAFRHIGNARGVCFAQGGRLLVSAHDRGSIIVWEVNTGIRVRDYVVAHGKLPTVQVSPNGELIAIHSETKIELRRIPSWAQIAELKADSGTVLAFSSEGRDLIIGSSSGTISIWRITEEKFVRTLQVGNAKVTWGRSHPNGGFLFCLTKDGILSSWDLRSGSRRGMAHCHGDSVVALSADGQTIATAFEESIVLLSSESFEKLHSVRSGMGKIRSVSISPTNNILVSAGSWGVEVFDMTAPVAAKKRWLGIEPLSLAFSPNGEKLAVGCSDKFIRMIEFPTSLLKSRFDRLVTQEHNGEIISISADPIGARVLTISLDGVLSVWDLHSKQCVDQRKMPAPIELRNASVRAFALSRNAGIALSATERTISGWDLFQDRRMQDINSQVTNGHATALSGNGEICAVSTAAGSMRLWNVRTGEALGYYEPDCAGLVRDVSLTADGGLVAWSFDSHGEVPSGVLVAHLEKQIKPNFLSGESGAPNLVLFSSAGDWLVASFGNRIVVWDASRGSVVFRTSFRDKVRAFTISSDDRYIAVASGGRDIHLIELLSGRSIGVLTAEAPVTCLYALGESGLLISGQEDGSILVWGISEIGKKAFPPLPRPSHERLLLLWDKLGDGSPQLARESIRQLALTQGESKQWLRERLLYTPRSDLKDRTRDLMDQLESDDPNERETAFRKLIDLPSHDEVLILEMLRVFQSGELKERLKGLTEAYGSRVLSDANVLRHARAVEVLERIGDSESIETLCSLESSSPWCRVRVEASRAIVRLTRK